jgi:hypothetical protein
MLLNKVNKWVIIAVLFVVSTSLGCENIGIESPTEVDNQSLMKSSTDIDSNNRALPMRGSALSFDGINDYVVVADHPSLDMTNGFTVAAWIYLGEYTEWASVVTKGGLRFNAGNANNYTIHQSGPRGGADPRLGTEFGHLRFTGCTGLPAPLPESDAIIPLNEWHFITVTFDGTTLRFYLDGEPDGQQAISSPLCTNDEPLNIGADFPGGDEYWHGLIDELKIWNKPLKRAHIWAAMHGHASPLATALVGYWRFDEGSGNVAHDRSRHRNHGQLKGNPTWVSPGAPNQCGHERLSGGQERDSGAEVCEACGFDEDYRLNPAD